MTFAGGEFASLTYSGYGHFDSDEFCGGVSELGRAKVPASYGGARRALAAGPLAEVDAKAARHYGGESFREPGVDAPSHEHFGVVLVSCERGDIRPMPDGVHIYADLEHRFEPLAAPAIPRAEVIDELCAAVFEGRDRVHHGAWGLATLEVCLAMLESSRAGREMRLHHQVAVG